MRVRDSERVFEDAFDGPPDIDDLDAGLKERGGFVGEMVRDAGERGSIRLVDVDAGYGAANHGRVGGFGVGGVGGATDGVVKYKDLGGAGAELGKYLALQCLV